MAKHPYLPGPLRRRVLGMPRIQRALWALEALLIAALWGVLRLLDPDRAVRVVRALASRVGPRLSKWRNVRDNLAIMFPEQSREERAALVREICGEWGAFFADYAHIDRICGDGAEQRIEIALRGAPGWFPGSRPAVYVTAHLSSFQISSWAGTRYGRRVLALYEPNSNPILDRLIQRRRDVIACDMVAADGGMRPLMRELANGGSIGLVVDHRFDAGEMVPFFGVDTPTLTTPARLALHFGCDLVPVRVERITDGARFRITFYDAVRPSDPTRTKPEQALDMTRQVNEHFERWIRERPAQWITLKRRWPRGARVAPPEAAQSGVGMLPARAREA